MNYQYVLTIMVGKDQPGIVTKWEGYAVGREGYLSVPDRLAQLRARRSNLTLKVSKRALFSTNWIIWMACCFWIDW